MWYRVELNKDGSVSSVAEVETSVATDKGRLTRYIEAGSKAEASNLAAKWWERYYAREKAHAVEREQYNAANRKLKEKLHAKARQRASQIRRIQAQPLDAYTLNECAKQFDDLGHIAFRQWLERVR